MLLIIIILRVFIFNKRKVILIKSSMTVSFNIRIIHNRIPAYNVHRVTCPPR